MKLLPQNQITEQKRTEKQNDFNHTQKIRNEITELVKKLNELHASFETEKTLLDTELKIYREKTQSTIEDLRRDVSSLEDKRKELLKPITKDEKYIEKEKERIKAERELIAQKQLSLELKEAELDDKFELIEQRLTEIDVKGSQIDNRLRLIESSEKELKRSSQRLSQEWLTYHQTVNNFNADVVKLKNDIQNQANANSAYKESLEKERKNIKIEKQHLAQERLLLDKGWRELKLLKSK